MYYGWTHFVEHVIVSGAIRSLIWRAGPVVGVGLLVAALVVGGLGYLWRRLLRRRRLIALDRRSESLVSYHRDRRGHR